MNEISKSCLDSVEPYVVCAAIINTNAVVANYQKIASLVNPETKCSAVVKADAYGLGAVKIAPELEKIGCDEFFVATIDEGIELRNCLKNDKSKIFVLGGVINNTEEYFTSNNLIPVIVNDDQLTRWRKYGQKIERILPCVFHVDTGMARNGFTPERMIEIGKNDNLTNFDIKYIMSHFACADDVMSNKSKEQVNIFNDVCKFFQNIKRSMSSTNGIFLDRQYGYEMARIGKALYGFAIRDDLIGSLNPAIEIYARIVQINEILPGQTVGYGATFKAKKRMKLATIGMGYADGLMRKLSQFGYAYIDDFKVPMVGRISMDYAVFDVTDVPEEKIVLGNWMSLANSEATLEQMSIDSGTIPHEITCKLGKRVKKIYVKN